MRIIPLALINPIAGLFSCGDSLQNFLDLLSIKLASFHNDLNFFPMTSPETDDDIMIRAIFHGWHNTAQRHVLDPAWEFLQAVDQGIFCRSGPVERVATLRLMRLMLLV
jgi:hypothetical protein